MTDVAVVTGTSIGMGLHAAVQLAMRSCLDGIVADHGRIRPWIS